MATTTFTMQIHFNHHDQRQRALVEDYRDFVKGSLKMFDKERLQLLNTQPDHATVAYLVEQIEKDAEDAANATRHGFRIARKDAEARFDMLEADLRFHWHRLMEPKITLGDYNTVYKHRSVGPSTLKSTWDM